ncbi:rhomboid family intramembrane serine protease [Archangium gephyra]|nr:rhomboid family intramembrane serine protease [Archangium gephyra]
MNPEDLPQGPYKAEPEPAAPPPVRQPWPPVCAAVLGGSVALFVLDLLLARSGANPGALGPVFQRIALFGPLVQNGEYWRVLSCVFSHGGPLHLAFNMWVGYSIGFPLERAIGSGRFLVLSLMAALGSSAFALFFNFDVPTVGASGMILGWAGAMVVIATREFRKSLFVWLAQVALLSLLPGVSWAGHLGGFLFGVPVGFALLSGHRAFARAAPLLLAVATVAVYLTAHPERFNGPG